MGPLADWKKRLKHVLGVVLYRTGAHRFFVKGKGTIVAFHRVDDRMEGNPISCMREQFDAYCAFFRRHFDVISLTELLDRLEEGRDLSGTLVVTFDDGYRDNRYAAAPTLERHGLPATFFVTTGFIGTSTTSWWDEEQGIASEWMTWSDVRELEEMGFEVAPHTVSHVDLGKVNGKEARIEIAGSAEQLRDELHHPAPAFSYPYGRPEEMTEENRELVRQLGFRCCLSAFGGAVRNDTDPFELPRLAISPWYSSPYHLGWELLFGND